MNYAILSNGMKIPVEELLLSDEDLATCVGKSIKQVQKYVREMERDSVGRLFINKYGKRSTNLLAFKAWIKWHDDQKYKTKKRTFQF
ncbi:hypothetical protein MX111_09205 [Streptococcus uberis]|uniref:hypothetical protein n=1 Tax=Streptococcus uberis TaxID=1349 RepID=UPI0027DB494A|nr:hypothetical protein [Streptococcus uberis]MCK1239579.1 hypothetical protein [Streptococcus uberis]